MMSLVHTTNLTGRHLATLVQCPRRALLAMSVFVWLLYATTGADDIVVAYPCSWCPAPHIRCFAVREGPDIPPRIPCF